MKRRRELGPKRQKNMAALIKYVLFAVAAVVSGSGLAFLANHFIGPQPADSDETISFLHHLSGIIIGITLLTVIGLLFFGFRAYFSGSKARHTMLSNRKRKKPH